MNDGSMGIAEYYMARGKPGDANACLVGVTALYKAARGGHLTIVRGLLAGGADIYRASSTGCTPVLVAGGKGHMEEERMG